MRSIVMSNIQQSMVDCKEEPNYMNETLKSSKFNQGSRIGGPVINTENDAKTLSKINFRTEFDD